MQREALYELPAARTPAQRRYMEELEAAGICVFCREHFDEYHGEPVEIDGTHWFATRNDFPYEGTSAHFLIVAQAHVTSFDELPDEAGAELWAIKRELKAAVAPQAVATVERSGATRYNGGSVAHLHVHFVALDASPAKTVRFRVSAKADGPDDR